jgi:hypothetical protein
VTIAVLRFSMLALLMMLQRSITAFACSARVRGDSSQDRPKLAQLWLQLSQPKRKKKRQREAGVKLLRQVSYRQETYRAVGVL